MLIDDYIGALPDSFAKSKDSNNYKLLSIEQASVQALMEDIKAVDDIKDIKKATGATLDLYGSMCGQARGSMTDEQYRYIIMQKVARNFVGCDHTSIVTALATVFEVPVETFGIEEVEGETCLVEITSLPYSVLASIGITGKQAREIIKAMITAGVRLAPLDLEGTFEFAASEDVYDENAGFGDVEQTMGGYLGYLESNDIDIPV